MLSALLTVFALLLLGHLAYRLKRFPDNTPDVLNRFVIDVCLPATILRLVPTLKFDSSLWVLVVTPWALAACAYAMTRVLARALRLDDATRTAFFLILALGNTSFLGFPLCAALLGESSVPLAAVYDQLGSFLILSSVAPVALSAAGPGERPQALQLLAKVIKFPPFIALLLALLPLPLPTFVQPLLTTASAALVPLAMFSVGMKMRLTPPRPRRVFALGLILKLGVLPALAWALATAVGVPKSVLQVSVLESAMPTMITAGAVIMAAGLVPELVAAFVGWGLVISLLTVPLWAHLLR